MNSEKATAVSPSSSPRARGPSVLDLLWSAAGVIAALQSKRDQPRPEDDQVPQERETAETDQFSLLARQQVMCVCVHADTIIDNRFYTGFSSPVVRKVAHLFFLNLKHQEGTGQDRDARTHRGTWYELLLMTIGLGR